MLPAAVEEDLQQALAYDLDRHTPFKPDELYFDAAIVGRDAQRGEIRVDWAAALAARSSRRASARRAGAPTVVAVTPDAPGSEGPLTTGRSRLNLLPARSARPPHGGAAGVSGRRSRSSRSSRWSRSCCRSGRSAVT